MVVRTQGVDALGERWRRTSRFARARWLAVAALATAVLHSQPGRAAPPSTTDTSRESQVVHTTVVVTSPGDSPWPDALDAINFELNQAGYTIVSATDAEAQDSPAIVEIERIGDEWELRCIGAAERVQQRGLVSDGPELVAMLAVELVVATRAQVPDVAPPETESADPPPPIPGTVGDPTPSLIAIMPGVKVKRPRWAAELGASFGSLGQISMVGVEAGIRHRWSRIELGLNGTMGALQSSEDTDSTDGTSTTLEMQWLGRAGLTAFYVFRPGRRVRPSIGATSSLVLPVVRSTRIGREDGDPQGWVDRRVTSAGVLWAPTATAGIRVGLRPPVAWTLSAFAGPSLTLRRPRLASGETLTFAGWTVGLSTGFMFGSGTTHAQ